MKSKLLLRTNLFLCVLLTAGFAAVSLLNYASTTAMFQKGIAHVSELTAESIYYRINGYFTKPLSVSMTMANDSLLKHLLTEETDRMGEAAYLDRLQGYLNAYKEQYGYDSVFLVSTRTNRYYHFNGLDRVLTRDNPENKWYYSFLENPQEYALNVDNDEAKDADQAITTFINCKIYDNGGEVMGVVGVGLRVGNLHELLQSYKDTYGVRAVLIDDTGTAAISSEHEGSDLTSRLFDNFVYLNESNLKSVIAEIGAANGDKQRTLRLQGQNGDCFVASQYVSIIQWRLIVESDTAAVEAQFRRRLFLGLGITVLIVFSVLVIVNKVVLTYNDRLLKKIVSQEAEYNALIKETTREMYADVYEFDVTRGRAVGEDTRRYFKALGAGGDVDFQQAMEVVAAKQIHQEFQQGFLAVFAREKVLEAFYNGIRELNYEAMMNTHWEEYHWVRIRARLFFWNVDQSVHMVLYNQDVHEEKERECRLLQDCLIDPLTGLYNRRFIEERLDKLVKSLSRTKGVLSILLIDVDFFKKYNDTYGHSMGDTCLKEVAGVLRGAAKREEDYVARYGGEEFIVILPNTDAAGACIVAEMLLWRMTACAIPHEKSEIADCVTISIGGVTGAVTYACDMREYLQVADKALYASKARGRNCYTGEMV